MHKLIVASFGLLLTCGGAVALKSANAENGAQKLSLADSIEMALAKNPRLRKAGQQIDAAAGRAIQARRWPNPEVEFSAEEVPPARSFGEEGSGLVGLSQTLPFPGKKGLDGEIGRWDLNAAEAQTELAQRKLVRDVKVSYFKVLGTENLLQIADSLVKVAAQSAAAATRRVEAGDLPFQEELRAEVQLQQAQTRRTSKQRELQRAKQELIVLLGDSQLVDISPSDVLSPYPDKELLTRQPQLWLERHPALRAAQAEQLRSSAALRRARLEPYPDVKLGVAGGRDWDSDASIIELTFSVPLPILDRSQGRIQEAHALAGASASQLEAVRQTLMSAWAESSNRYSTLIAETTAYRQRILRQADKALQLVQEAYTLGKSPLIDLLDTQRMAAEAHELYLERLLELNIAKADLEALTGES